MKRSPLYIFVMASAVKIDQVIGQIDNALRIATETIASLEKLKQDMQTPDSEGFMAFDKEDIAKVEREIQEKRKFRRLQEEVRAKWSLQYEKDLKKIRSIIRHRNRVLNDSNVANAISRCGDLAVHFTQRDTDLKSHLSKIEEQALKTSVDTLGYAHSIGLLSQDDFFAKVPSKVPDRSEPF